EPDLDAPMLIRFGRLCTGPLPILPRSRCHHVDTQDPRRLRVVTGQVHEQAIRRDPPRVRRIDDPRGRPDQREEDGHATVQGETAREAESKFPRRSHGWLPEIPVASPQMIEIRLYVEFWRKSEQGSRIPAS